MPLREFIQPVFYRSVRFHLALLVRLIGLSFAPAVLVAVLAGEWSFGAILVGIGGFAFASGWAAGRGDAPRLEIREGLVVTALAYVVYATLASVAFLPVAPWIDGFFESISGITTTGLTMMDEATLPASLLFLRAYSQWLGGLGIAVLSLVIILGPGNAAFTLYASEFGHDNLLGSVRATARVVAMVYSILTAAAVVVYTLVGMPVFDAVVHAMSSLSTGGFSARSDSIGAYASPAIQAAVIPFMLLGAVSLPLFYQAWRRGWRRLIEDAQTRALLACAVTGAAIIVVAEGGAAAVLQGTFHAVSALTTTGFSVGTTSAWSDGARLVAIVLMAIGGSTGSTVGGIKLFRVIVLAKLAGWSALRAMLPSKAVVPIKVQGVAISDREIRGIAGVVAAYLAIGFASAVALTFTGAPLEHALFDALSALSTVGLSVGVTSSDMPDWSKLVLCLNMWVGRLEFLPVLVLLYPGSWLPSKES